MQKGSVELVFILDKSGSMAGLEKDTIGGFNAMLDKQKAVEGECRITTPKGTISDEHFDVIREDMKKRGGKA